MKNASFCYIAPTKYLDYTTASKTHLTLAHLIDKDEEYAEFYRKRGEAGDYIMMDNSAYELKEPFSPEKLLDLAGRSGAKAIVLPDYPFKEARYTIEAAKQFAPIFKEAGFETFFVPQSVRGRLTDWVSAYTWAKYNPLIDIIGMSILGIPNALPEIDPSYARVVMTRLLQDCGEFAYEKKHHYLGLNSGPALEIPSLIRMNALDTIDSSGPVWSAILGHAYTKEADSYQMVKKLKMPVQFDIHRTKDTETLSRIQHNINLTQELMTVNTTGTWYAQE